jgi:GH24 family phage-related lysozyme (muramidase)
MKEKSVAKKLFSILTIAFLLVLPFSFLPSKAFAQLLDLPIDTNPVEDAFPGAFPLDGTGGPTDGEQTDPVAERQKLDDEQTKKEAERLKKAQEEEDIKVCKKDQESVNTEVGGTGAGGSQPGQDDAFAPENQNQGPIPPACQQGDGSTAGYVAANEGVRYEAYTDSRGYRTVGVGHQITGNEPFPVENVTLTDDQVNQLYDADMATAQTNAQASAERHGVDWETLSPERQTALTDMSFNMGASGGRGLDGFDDMWGNTREAQRTGNQADWDAAGDEIMDSPYATQVGQRSNRNAEIMRNSDGAIIDQRISEDTAAQGLCGPVAFNWQKPFSVFSLLFKANNAFAQTYVPVQEQKGPLLDKTEEIRSNIKKIEKSTDETKKLSIQICTHLRAIKRIQQGFEKKMVEDANVSRAKATEIEKYKQALFGENGAIKTAYASLDENGNQTDPADKENGKPLYVTNNQQYMKGAADEGLKIATDDIASNNNINNNAVFQGLQAENSFGMDSGPSLEDIQNVMGTGEAATAQNNSSLANGIFDHLPIISSLLRPVRNTLAWVTGSEAIAAPIDAEIGDQVNSDQFWNSFLTVVQKNPGVTYLRASGYIEQSKNAAILAARDTAAQGQGFLPVRDCLAKTSDGKTCAVWGTVQPGIIVKETQAAAANSRLTQYENAKTMGDLAPGNGPDIVEVLTNKPAPGGGGALGPGMTAPADIATQAADRLRSDPSTNPGGGDSGGDGGDAGDYGEGGAGWGDLTGLVEGLFSEDGGADPESNQAIQLILGALGDLLDSLKPWVVFKAKDMGDGISRVYWYSPNADNCISNNKWLEGDGTTVVKEVGASIEKTGSIDITVTSGQSVEYKIKCNNSKGGSTRSLKVKR